MSRTDVFKPLATDQEAEMAKVAQCRLMAALEHSGAQRIALVDAKGALAEEPVLELPDGHFKFPRLWPVKLPRAGRPNYESVTALSAMRDAASLSL